MSEEGEFVDADSYQGGGKDQLSFKIIMLLHLKKISQFQSKELRGGYWIKKTVAVGGSMIQDNYYIPDTREEFCGVIEHLHDLLLPHFDKGMNEARAKHDKAVDVIEKEYFEADNDDKYEQRFRRKKCRLCRKLFQELSLFLKRENYLEIANREE